MLPANRMWTSALWKRAGSWLLLLTFCSCAATPPPAPRPALSPALRPAPPPPPLVLPPINFDKGANLEVFWVQGVLEDAGYDPGPQDGIMGPRTRGELNRFQRDQDLPKTGRIDPATKAALQRVSPLLPNYLKSETSQQSIPKAEPRLGFEAPLLEEYPVY